MPNDKTLSKINDQTSGVPDLQFVNIPGFLRRTGTPGQTASLILRMSLFWSLILISDEVCGKQRF
ncbi:Uncharacterized protein dnm_079410 [Desulfonema magnum]|uniref:Uncharacterized protein n=1 Tax=Desulfonema magnum TaxID=45655 RepID=A0A975BV18_9BACT|nr:Uncharacterized protein dnm_079410 [Desulfonema magnum]